MTNQEAQPKVSILCATFNHVNYIEKCLDGFLMQGTDFEFEILINDDASTDGTSEILQEYKRKHPDMITIVSHDTNQYQQGVRGMMKKFLLPIAKGEYICTCEGDDYWTDPKKLQVQVDFMDKNDDYALCFHPVLVKWEDSSKEDIIFPENKEDFSLLSLLKDNFIQTTSVMYRRQDYSKISPDNIIPTDWYTHLFHAQFGKIGFIDKIMAVYRRNNGGIWITQNQNEFWQKHGLDQLKMVMEVRKMYGFLPKQREVINLVVSQTIGNLGVVDKAIGTDLLTAATEIDTEDKAFIIQYRDLLIHSRNLEALANKREGEVSSRVRLGTKICGIVKHLLGR